MYRESTVPDVFLAVGNEKLAVHRFVLASHSRFFQVLLFGQVYMESNQPVVTIEAPLNAMKILLEFSYSGSLDLRTFALPDVANLLELAHRYEFSELEKTVARYLRQAVNAENVVSVLQIADLVNEKQLKERCWTIIEMIAEGIYDVDLALSYDQLIELLDCEPRKVTEIKLFEISNKMMQTWSAEQREAIISKIQFSRMMIDDLLNTVEPLKVIEDGKLIKVMKEISFYKAKHLDEHKPITKIAKVLQGINPENLFERGIQFTSHEVKEPASENCILVDLGTPYIINSIDLNCSEKVQCNYYIEVSTTMETWTRVVDLSKHYLTYRQNQEHYFSEVIARYIRFIGIVSGKNFECNSVKIAYIQKPPKFLNGITVPHGNVAIPTKAIVNFTNSKKKLECDTQLLNGSYEDKGLDTEFMSQNIDNGVLLILFRQPYILSSCRFRLWDYDGRKYCYKVEACSYKGYELISDKSDELMDGWQRIEFSPRWVKWFRITGVKASIGTELRFVHFEAPAQA